MGFIIEGKSVIITGGARGFGLEFGHRVLRRGGKVCFCDINEEVGQEAERELSKKYGKDRVLFKKCNVVNADEVRELWEAAEAKFGYISLMVNNAGINPNHGWEINVDVMLKGVAHGTYLALEKMDQRKDGGQGGRIINIASAAGLLTGLGNIEGCGYTMAKWGTVALTRSFARVRPRPAERHGVKAYALCPWFAFTNLVQESVTQSELERKTKTRVLKVSEVGDAFETALDRDKTGACYSIFPDTPLMDLPNLNEPMYVCYVVVGRIINKLGINMEVLSFPVVAAVTLVLLYLAYFFLTFFLGFFF